MQQLTRAEITVYGEVQRVGYRYIAQDTARRFNVKGYVQNMPDGTVKITAEAPKETMKKFIKALKIVEPPVKIERIQTKYSKPTNEFKYFTIKYGTLVEEVVEGFGAIVNYLKLYIDDMRSISHKKISTKAGNQLVPKHTVSNICRRVY